MALAGRGLSSAAIEHDCVLAWTDPVLPVAPGRVPQIVCHLDGVGTGQGTGRVSRALDRALGGAFGQGLMASVAAAYRFLVFTWAPGDEIQLFGFSRGAYTARSLAGLIRNVGILPRRAAAQTASAIWPPWWSSSQM